MAPIIKPRNMTREEVFQSVLNCYKDYYMWKLPQWVDMKGNDFKRTILLKGMKAIVENSVLKDHMGDLGEMPESVRELIAALDAPEKLPATGKLHAGAAPASEGGPKAPRD